MIIQKTCDRQSNNNGHDVKWLQFDCVTRFCLYVGFEFPCCYEKLIYIEGRLFKQYFKIKLDNQVINGVQSNAGS